MLNIIIRTLLIYIIVIGAVRIMGKRQVSDMQDSELVITLIISEVASLPLENPERPLLMGLVPILMLAAIEIAVSLIMLKSRKVRGIICGHPIVIIKDGKMIESEMRRLRLSREDVYSLLRGKNFSDEKGIQYGVIEQDGSFSALEQKNISSDGVESRDLSEAMGRAEQNDDSSSNTPKQNNRKKENKL